MSRSEYMSGDDHSDTEAFYLACCDRMPEDEFRHEVELLAKHGYNLTTENTRAVRRLAAIFNCSTMLVFVRLLQVYPELKKRLAI